MEEKKSTTDFEEISLKEMLLILIKGKWLIAAITVVCCITGVLGFYILKSSSYTVSSIIEFSFSSINSALNPDGSRFDPTEIRNPDIVSKALKNLGLEQVGIEGIRQRIQVNPITPGNIQELAKLKLEQGEIFTYNPSTYEVVLNVDKGLKLSKAQTRQLVDEITNVYTASYIEKYSSVGLIANILSQFDAELLDYPEMSTVMNKQLDILINYLSTKSSEAPFFRSTITGYTFDDVLQSLNIIKSIDIRSMDSTIGLYLLTKDKQKLINSYKYAIELKEVEMAKAEKEAGIARDMMDSFDTSTNSVIIPGIGTDLTSASELKSDESYYDSLANRSTNASVLASDTLLDIEYLKERIYKLESSTVTYKDKQKAIEQVMNTVERIQAELAEWIEVSNILVDEYYEIKYAQAITPLVSSQIISSMRMSLVAAVSLVIGLMLGVFTVFFRNYWTGGVNTKVRSAYSINEE